MTDETGIEVNGKRYYLFRGLEGVTSRSALVELLRELARETRENPDGWENWTVPDYLDALASWLTDADGLYRHFGLEMPTEPSWKLIAKMLDAARVYE